MISKKKKETLDKLRANLFSNQLFSPHIFIRGRTMFHCVLLKIVCVCVCVKVRGSWISWKRSNSWDQRNSCISSRPALLLPSPLLPYPSLPERTPHTPFSDPSLPHSCRTEGFLPCTPVHTRAQNNGYEPLRSFYKQRQDARATKHLSIG